MNGDFLAARFMQVSITSFIVTAVFISPTGLTNVDLKLIEIY